MFKRALSSALLLLVPLSTAIAAETAHWPNGTKVAISLSYDDALNSQLNNAAPSLDKHGFKASFYLTLTSPSLRERLPEWRALSMRGHELGNHTIFHPCSSSLPDRDWVKPYHDMDVRAVEQMVEEIITANTILNALDGMTKRTFTPPCDDLLASGDNYLPAVSEYFVAIKGQNNGMPANSSLLWVPVGNSGQELIDYIKDHSQEGMLLNILFHGVGGDYLTVSTNAHDELLQFLAENRETYWVDTYLNIMTFARDQQ